MNIDLIAMKNVINMDIGWNIKGWDVRWKTGRASREYCFYWILDNRYAVSGMTGFEYVSCLTFNV